MTRKHKLLFTLTICVLITLGIYLYIISEHYLYFWDFSHNQFNTIYTEDQIFRSPQEWYTNFQQQVQFHDYNSLIVIPLALIAHFIPISRLSYILSITILYAIPALLVYAFTYKNVYSHTNKKSSFVLAVFVFLLVPQIWIPLLRGYPEILALGIICIILYLTNNKGRNDLFFTEFLTGVLMALLIILRRYFAVWVGAYFITESVCILHDAFTKNGNIISNTTQLLVRFAAGLYVLYLIGSSVIFDRLLQNYSILYSAYRFSGSMPEAMKNSASYFGPITTLLFLISLFTRRTKQVTKLTILSLIAFVYFYHIQDPYLHHYYLILPAVLVLITTYIENLWVSGNTIFISVLLTIGILNSLYIYGTLPQVNNALVQTYYQRFPPLQRGDIPAVNRLISDLDSMIEKTDGSVYVLSSSESLNSDTLKYACFFYRQDRGVCEKIQYAFSVDRSEGFPHGILNAQYVVIPFPQQYHLRADDQRVVVYIREMIVNSTTLGKYYARIPTTYHLDGDVTAYIYTRNSIPYHEKDLQYIQNAFLNWYPDLQDKFTIM